MKRCPKCKQGKDETNFCKNKSMNDGLSCWCKECSNKYNTKYRRKCGIKAKKYAIVRNDDKKLCNICKQWLHEFEFSKNKRSPDNLNHACKKCVSHINKQKQQSLMGKYQKYRSSAKYRNIKFAIAIFDFASIIIQPCHYCGRKDGIYNGIDRVDNSNGYVKENCVACCSNCNYAKLNLTVEEFKSDVKRRYSYMFN